MMNGKELSIVVPPPRKAAENDNGMMGRRRTELKFPETFCKDIRLFDRLVAKMRQGSEQGLTSTQMNPVFTLEVERHYKRDILPAEADSVIEMSKTYAVFDELRRHGRDSVWTYVARNLSRPLALSFETGWAHVVVGNPPWLAFRHMTPELQKRFRDLARGERVYVGGKFATQNDLAALFTVRATALYLRSGGRIAFILPLAALSRGQFENLRSGSFHNARIVWDEVWTMDESVKPLFPVPSCVVFGRRRATAKPIPDTVTAFSGTLPYRDSPEAIADDHLIIAENAPRRAEGVFEGGSTYRRAFRQGATLVPRMLCFIERKVSGRLGSDPTVPYVVSRRTTQEKEPWKSLPGIEHRIEAEFLQPVLLGESILPYRVFRPFEAIVPVTSEGNVLNAQGAAERGASGLSGWMRQAEAVWKMHAESGSMTLIGRWNYHNELSAQFPLAPLRVVYAKAGTLPAACLVQDASVIDHKLYWAVPESEHEGRYLTAVLNSEVARSRAAALQSRGQWGARDFDKVVFTLPIPRFDASDELHADLAAAAREAAKIATSTLLPENAKFQRARKVIRAALIAANVASRIDALVERLLDGK